jgi:hypothetical protein
MRNVAVVPLTVQTEFVKEAKLTGRPELAEATSASGVLTVCVPGLANVIAWAVKPALTVKLCVTGAAAAYVPLPACDAVMEQVPAETNVAEVPFIVQTPVVVEAKATVRPELAVATSVTGVPTVCVPGLANVIVCAVRPALTNTVTVCAAVVPEAPVTVRV